MSRLDRVTESYNKYISALYLVWLECLTRTGKASLNRFTLKKIP